MDVVPRGRQRIFRHTFASLQVLNGAQLAWLQEQLGHSDVRLTRTTYGRWFKQRDLVAADHQDSRSALVVTEVVTDAGNFRVPLTACGKRKREIHRKA